MKQYILILTTIILGISSLSAQNRTQAQVDRDEYWKKINAQKIAYITDYISLTSSESAKFWPVYNKYWDEKTKLSHQRRELFNKIEKQTANQADLNLIIKLSEEETRLISSFSTEITKILSVDKAAKTFVAEDRFKRKLMHHTRSAK